MTPMNGDRLEKFANGISGGAIIQIMVDGDWRDLDPAAIRAYIPPIIVMPEEAQKELASCRT